MIKEREGGVELGTKTKKSKQAKLAKEVKKLDKSKELNKKIVKSLEEIEKLSKKLSKDKDNVKLSILIKEKEIKYLKLQQKLDSKKKKKK